MSEQLPSIAIFAPPNSGKAQPLHCKIKSPSIPNLTFRNVQVGDKIFGEDGKVYDVTEVHEQGRLDCYDVSFSNGTKTQCNDEHLWTIVDAGGNEFTYTLRYIIEHFSDNLETLQLPSIVPMNYWYDDNVHNNEILFAALLKLNINHLELPHTYSCVDSDITTQFLKYLLVDKFEYEKDSIMVNFESQRLSILLNKYDINLSLREIPSSVMFSSLESRKVFLELITDATGSYTSSNEALSRQVQELYLSTGVNVNFNINMYKGDWEYTVSVSNEPVTFKRIIKNSSKTEMRCISTSNPTSLYLTDTWIPTHNTYSMKPLNSDGKGKDVLYINGDNKALPWFGANNFQRYTLTCPTKLPEVIEQAGRLTNTDGASKFNIIIVDTLTRVIDNYVSRYVSSKEPKYVYDKDGNLITNMNYVAVTKTGQIDGLKAWGYLSSLFKDIMTAAEGAKAQVIFTNHMVLTTKSDGTYTYEAPMQGQVGKVGVAAWFSITLVARSVPIEDLANEPDTNMLGKEESRAGTGHRYVFQIEKTKDTSEYPIRTIDGMFPPSMHYIDNDMDKLITHLKNLYAGTNTGLEHLY